MKSEHLLKLLSDSFGPKAESINVKSFHLYFEDRPSILVKMKESKHQFLVGRRGTGKTMFLKYLDLATLASSPRYRENLPAIGFYINLGRFAIPNISLLSSDFASSIFSKWLPIKCSASVLDGLEKGIKSNLLQTDEQFLDVIASIMIGANNPKGAFTKLKNNVQLLIQKLESLCSSQNFDIKELNKIRSPIINMPLENLLNKISSHIRLMLGDRYRNVPGIFFLLDRYDELTRHLQNFINPMIHWGSPQEYYVKIGVTRTDILQLKDIPHRDYRIIPIEFPPTTEGEQDYHRFAIPVLEKRLHAISQNIQEIDPKDVIASAFKDINKLFPDSLDREDLVLYSGFKVLEKLSARNISVFLAYVFAILRKTVSNIAECDLLRSTGHIPFDLQHRAIIEEATDRFKQEFPTQVEASTKKLYTFLVNQLHSEKSRSYLYFTLKGEVDSEDNQKVNQALKQLNLVNVITPLEDSNLPYTYELSQFFLPQARMTLAVQGIKEISVSKARDYITGEPHKAKAWNEKQPELFEQRPVCFFPTGFRNPWENKARLLLEESIFTEAGLEYKDGAKYHPDSMEIGECVKRLMQEVDFFIVEFSTFNENVAFEVGLAIAMGRPTYGIRNRKMRKRDIDIKPSSEFRDLVEGYKQKNYNFEYDDETLESPVKEEYVKSLGTAIKDLSNIFRSLPNNKRQVINPFDNTQQLIPARPPEKVVFLYFPQGSKSATWHTDIEHKLREERIENPYPYRSDVFKGRQQIIMSRLKAICRSKHCVIDTSGKDQYACLLLGFAMAIDGPEILHVYDRENSGLFTNWKGWHHHPYSSKEELLDLIKEFIQRT